ncbi:hypothetical protein RRG08_028930 [Elysia crispata]|uniref:Uncharacterized protein n=1 Tax=Elysia crispata TaxID=231223 RepID=A0AAE1APS9_9GAST|nr:hypothetical protein RRG08_028930 [Elysia crispata]
MTGCLPETPSKHILSPPSTGTPWIAHIPSRPATPIPWKVPTHTLSPSYSQRNHGEITVSVQILVLTIKSGVRTRYKVTADQLYCCLCQEQVHK